MNPFLRFSLLSLVCAPVAWAEVGPVATEAAKPEFSVANVRVISDQPDVFLGWPTVGKKKSGELVVVYSGGRDDHVCPFGRIEMTTSKDGGNTWTAPRTIIDSATDDRDAGVFESQKGTLLVTFFTSLAYQKHLSAPERRMNAVFGDKVEEHIARWKLADARFPLEQQREDVGYWIMRSTDGGLTWGERLRTPCYSPHGPTQMADGRLLYAASSGKATGVWTSSDEGVTWDLLTELPIRPGETHGVEAGDGSIIVQVRDRVTSEADETKKEWATVQTESRDGGKTWSDARVITRGFPPHLVRLANNDLLMTYGSRKAPYGIRFMVSRDHGRTWSPEAMLTTDAADADVGYPSTVQLADGSLVSIWYEVPEKYGMAVLKQAKWSLK